MKKILLVEDSKIVGKKYKDFLEKETPHTVTWVKSMQETLNLLNQTASETYLLAIVDLHLPDCEPGDAVDETIKHNIPTIAFSSDTTEETQKRLWAKGIIDYVSKAEDYSFDHIAFMVERIKNNRHTKVLVADDSKMFRKILCNLLQLHQFQIFEASNGQEALDIIKKEGDIKLLITDCEMPVMDGFKLIREARKIQRKEYMAIIGISSTGKNELSARLIKAGANDFIIKQSFLKEEFFCRVNQCISALENLEKVREAAIKDFLTGLYNRRYFLDVGAKYLSNALRHEQPIVCAMLDIDHFKNVNDNYGHDVGDIVIKHVSQILQESFRKSDIVSRFGGEEFCIHAPNMNKEDAEKIFERIRKTIEESSITTEKGEEVAITISIGVTTEPKERLHDMVKVADELLYEAKDGGRNNVVMN